MFITWLENEIAHIDGSVFWLAEVCGQRSWPRASFPAAGVYSAAWEQWGYNTSQEFDMLKGFNLAFVVSNKPRPRPSWFLNSFWIVSIICPVSKLLLQN